MDTLSLDYLIEMYKNGHQEGVVKGSGTDWAFRNAKVQTFALEELRRRVDKARTVAQTAEQYPREEIINGEKVQQWGPKCPYCPHIEHEHLPGDHAICSKDGCGCVGGH